MYGAGETMFEINADLQPFPAVPYPPPPLFDPWSDDDDETGTGTRTTTTRDGDGASTQASGTYASGGSYTYTYASTRGETEASTKFTGVSTLTPPSGFPRDPADDDSSEASLKVLARYVGVLARDDQSETSLMVLGRHMGCVCDVARLEGRELLLARDGDDGSVLTVDVEDDLAGAGARGSYDADRSSAETQQTRDVAEEVAEHEVGTEVRLEDTAFAPTTTPASPAEPPASATAVVTPPPSPGAPATSPATKEAAAAMAAARGPFPAPIRRDRRVAFDVVGRPPSEGDDSPVVVVADDSAPRVPQSGEVGGEDGASFDSDEGPAGPEGSSLEEAERREEEEDEEDDDDDGGATPAREGSFEAAESPAETRTPKAVTFRLDDEERPPSPRASSVLSDPESPAEEEAEERREGKPGLPGGDGAAAAGAAVPAGGTGPAEGTSDPDRARVRGAAGSCYPPLPPEPPRPTWAARLVPLPSPAATLVASLRAEGDEEGGPAAASDVADAAWAAPPPCGRAWSAREVAALLAATRAQVRLVSPPPSPARGDEAEETAATAVGGGGAASPGPTGSTAVGGARTSLLGKLREIEANLREIQLRLADGDRAAASMASERGT